MAIAQRQPEEVIEQWMTQIVKDGGGVDRFDDLHIDDIHGDWKNKNVWIEHALEAFRIAVDVRNRNGMKLSVCLGFSLRSSDTPTEINFRTKEQLRDQLDWSPPSLYLFRYGNEPHTQTESARVDALSPAILNVVNDARCYYIEFKPQDACGYCRSVFVEG